jgi:hypothetical protein
MKKRMVITALTVAVILLGIFGGIAAAQGQDADKIIRGPNTLTSKMAEILGIDEDRMEQAFKQAVSETRDERMKDHLARLVETGKITQEQADHKFEWMTENPGFWKKRSSFGNPHDKHGHPKGHYNRMN